MLPAGAEGSAVRGAGNSLPLQANRRSLGFARDDNSEKRGKTHTPSHLASPIPYFQERPQ